MSRGEPVRRRRGVAQERVPHPHGALRRRTRPGGARPASRVDGVRCRGHHRPLDAHARALDRSTCLVITGAELAADPYGGALVDSEILAIGISDIPEDPGGDRAKWGPIDAYTYKTFPDLSAAARCIADQGGVSFIAHPYWSGMPLETLIAVEGAHGSSCSTRAPTGEPARGLELRLGSKPGPRQAPVGVRDRRLSLSGVRHQRCVDDGACGRAQRGGGARCVAARPHTTPASGPEMLGMSRGRRRELEVRCSPARSMVMASRYETGWAVRADVRNRQEDARVARTRRPGPRGTRAVRATDGTAVPAHRDRGRTRAQGMVEPDLSADLAFAHELADVAAEVTMSWFGHRLPVELKDDETPVTEVDRRAEQAIRDAIAARHPGRCRLGRGSRPAGGRRTDAGG